MIPGDMAAKRSCIRNLAVTSKHRTLCDADTAGCRWQVEDYFDQVRKRLIGDRGR
jgi:hypothetical protein